MKVSLRHSIALVGVWLFLVVVSLLSRYYIPIDETRYVTVAWNMWIRGDFLVPYLNDYPYAHKPPLLFWLIHIGWVVFGVNDWWPRLVPSFFALASLFMTMRIANLLWPERDRLSRMSSIILFGSLLWMVFLTATMFDMLLAFFTLLGMFGLLTAWRGASLRGWLTVCLSIGLGLLAKGPTIFLQILPAAALAPFWAKHSNPNWWNWYGSMLCAAAAGSLIALTWAIPAGILGGEAYRHEIFWGQTAGRVVDSFAHQRPVWWYCALMPVMLFPWLFWGGVWQGLRKLRSSLNDAAVRFSLAWAFPVFLVSSFVSGKQAHYLLPVFPAFALLIARGLDDIEIIPGRMARLAVALPLMLTGIVLISPHQLPASVFPVEWSLHVPALSGIMLLFFGICLLVLKGRSMERQVWVIASGSLSMVLILHVALMQASGLSYDIRPISAKIKALQDAGIPLANNGKYHGQYQFAGRLLHSIEEVRFNQLAVWFDTHPGGRVIFYSGPDSDKSLGHADFVQPYRNGTVGIYSREALLAPHDEHGINIHYRP